MANDFNSYSISSGKGSGLAKGYSSSFKKRFEDQQDEEDKKALLKAQQEQADKEKTEQGKSLLDRAKDFLGDTAKNVGAAAQQGAGLLGDVAIEGGGVLDEVANQIKGGSEADKDKRRIENVDRSEAMRKKLHEQKDITGRNFEGTTGVDENASDIARGQGDLQDFAAVGGKGLEVGIDATSLLNPTSLAARGAAGAAPSILKTAAKDAAFFGGTQGAATTASTFGETGDLGKSLEEGGKAAALTGLTQGALDVAGGAVGKALGAKKVAAEKTRLADEEKVKTDAEAAKVAQDAADEQAASDLLARPFKDTPDAELEANIEKFHSGERSGNVDADYKTYQRQVDELNTRKIESDRETFTNNGLPNDIEGAQKALDDVDAGNLPDTAYKPAELVKSTEDIVGRGDVPAEIKNAAQEVETDRKMVNQQLEGLMSPQVKAEQVNRLDEHYDMQIEALQKKYAKLEQPTKGKDTTVDQKVDGQRLSGDYKSDIRYTMAKDKLDQEYQEQVAELDLLEAQDAPDVEQFQGMMDKLDQREQSIVADTRQMMQSTPDQFRDVDMDEAAAVRQQLVDNLDQAKRFNEPKRVIEEVSESPNPEANYNTNPDAEPAFARDVSNNIDEMHNTDIKDNFTHIDGLKGAALRIMSPSQVLEKWGLRKEGLDLHSDILRAESALNAANKADSEILSKINDILPNSPETQRQIVEYLEGKRNTLSSVDADTATQIRKFLDDKKAGLKEMGYATLDDYFPHMMDKADPEVQRLFKGKANGDIKFGNLNQRLTDSDNYSRDIMEVLTQYTSSYNRKTILEPALKPLDDIRTQVELTKAESQWLDDYQTQLKGFDNSKVGDAYNTFMDGVMEKMGKTNYVGKNHYAEHLGTQRMFSAMATMGLNPGTALRNMTQIVNTVADIGPRYATVGLSDGMKALRAGKGSPEWAELQAAGIMEGGVSQNYFDAITKPGVVGRAAKGRDTAVKGMMSMIRGTDILLRTQAYYGAKALAAAKGLTGKEAQDFAIRHVVDTQFITSRVDMPVAFNGQGVRSLTQLATFSGKQAGFLKKTAGMSFRKGKDGKYHADPKQMGSILAAVATATLATEALKPLLGFKETEWVPFYDQIAPFFGAEGGDSLYRSPLVTLLTGDGKSKAGLIQALQGQDVDGDGNKSLGEGFEKFLTDQWSSIVPGGTQLKKTIEGSQTTSSGESRNKSGNIRYLQDTDMDSQLKASLFGQYSTQAGQDWVRNGFPTLSEKQTENVDGQISRKAKKQYADYYVAKQGIDGRQDAYDAIKDAAKAGDTNKVARLTAEFNKKVDSAMAKYFKENEDLPKELQKDMLATRINAQNILEQAKKDKEDE